MKTAGFDPSAELLALRELVGQCSAAAERAEATLLIELDELDGLCRQFAENCMGVFSASECERAEALSHSSTAAQVSLAANSKVKEADAEALKELHLEMEQLRAELRTARRRLSEEKRRADSSRDDWASELDGLRKLLEPPTAALEQGPEPFAPVPSRKAVPPAPKQADPVLGAVLAQFQKLQQTGTHE
jgi:hypothetical protein